ncbi:mitochondrial inner membrane protease ATP23 [Ceratobasidium sp. AG-Ba]|nr:mitochondrial inner membrane protease ATP23 [Ceratobasidium sp. AG-Ba]
MGSPPKPWERAGNMAPVIDPIPPAPSLPAPTTVPTASSISSDAPTIPSRPDSIAAPQQPITSLSPYSANSYGSYSSPYNRFGSYGGYGGGYGGYGGGCTMGMGMGMMDPYNPSLTQSVAASTQQAFGLLGNVVGTFTSFAQMLDSSFMATQSSIFAILGVADQLSQLRLLLGQVAGVFGLVGWLRGWWRGERKGSMADDFRRFMRGDNGANNGAPRPKQKAVYRHLACHLWTSVSHAQLVRALSARLPPPPGAEQIDMSKVQFATAIFEFATTDPVELALKKGDLVAIIGRTEGGDWFRGRTRQGKQGWFPANHVQILKREAKKVDEPVVEPKNVDV